MDGGRTRRGRGCAGVVFVGVDGAEPRDQRFRLARLLKSHRTKRPAVSSGKTPQEPPNHFRRSFGRVDPKARGIGVVVFVCLGSDTQTLLPPPLNPIKKSKSASLLTLSMTGPVLVMDDMFVAVGLLTCTLLMR